jgi:hypothetical protein
MVDCVFGLGGGQGCGSEAEGAAEEASAGALRGEGVYVGIADHDGFVRKDWGLG